ncbi:MAG: hypothetical protein WC273_00260 [Dehalococcoidia bacterium]
MSPFARHYLEMVLAMFAGMFLLGPITFMALGMHNQMHDSAVSTVPLVRTVLMVVYMNVGMGAWMRYRGHSWERIGEMALAMTLPFIVLLPAMRAGVVTESFLNVVGHLAMLATMYLGMLLRRDEYSGHAHHAAATATVDAPAGHAEHGEDTPHRP